MFTITITITQDENNRISVRTNEFQPANKEPKQKKSAKPRKKKVEFQQLDTAPSFIPIDDDGIVPFDED